MYGDKAYTLDVEAQPEKQEIHCQQPGSNLSFNFQGACGTIVDALRVKLKLLDLLIFDD